MALIDIKLPKSIACAFNLPVSSPRRQQLKVLRKMLRKACFTEFGQTDKLDDILFSGHPETMFYQAEDGIRDSKIYKEWWYKTLEGKPDVCWPGIIKLFALSSGTSESASKYIPITKDLIRSNNIT